MAIANAALVDVFRRLSTTTRDDAMGKHKPKRGAGDGRRDKGEMGDGDGDSGASKGRGKGKQHHRRAKDDELTTLMTQLDALRLTRHAVDADGNCFFRALADQKYGDEHRHAELREKIVATVREREAEFAPFVEDDESFDDYVARMASDGEWAGHLEVIAATSVLGYGICIHQAGSPRWVAGANEADDDAKLFHVSYEGSDHYNSVRVRGGRLDKPGGPLSLAVLRDADLAEVVKRVGCADVGRIRRTLRACRNDVEACVRVIEDELEEEEEARKKAIADGVDVDAFDDGGGWAEVKTKKSGGKNKPYRRKGSIERDMEALAI